MQSRHIKFETECEIYKEVIMGSRQHNCKMGMQNRKSQSRKKKKSNKKSWSKTHKKGISHGTEATKLQKAKDGMQKATMEQRQNNCKIQKGMTRKPFIA